MKKLHWLAGLSLAAFVAAGSAQGAEFFTPGNLVVSVEGNGPQAAVTYTDNQAAPLSLYEFSTSGTNQTASKVLVLPQTQSGSNLAVSGEYGSSSEGILQLTGNGHQLTIMGYGVNAATYNANALTTYGSASLAQSTSIKGGAHTAVARVVAVIGANGQVNSSTALYNFADQNNPRSVYSADGHTFYVSGQGTGNGGDATGGVFLTTLGGKTLTPITGLDATGNTAGTTLGQDARVVTIYNGTLYVSVDTKEGKNSAKDFIGTLGSPPATSLFNGAAGPTQLNGFGTTKTGKFTITTGINSNGNGLNAGQAINLSPDQYFFANSTTLYVADTGAPKNDSNATSAGVDIGDGGLQKWTFSAGSWHLDYTLANGLSLVKNTASGGPASGTTGLDSLTGELIAGGTEVELFTTNYTIGDTDQTYLYGIADSLGFTTASQASGELFLKLVTAPTDTNFKGVAFAPVPEPGTWALLIAGLGMMGGMLRTQAGRRKAAVVA